MTARRTRIAGFGAGVAWLLAAAASADDGARAGEVRMALSEQQASLEQLVAIVEGLEQIAPQRRAVEALLGDSAGAERLRAALAAIEGEGPVQQAVSALTVAASPAAPPSWRPSAGDVVYVQAAPERVLLRHRSGALLELGPGGAGTVGGDRVSLVSVTAGEGGRPEAVALVVNGKAAEIELH